MIDRMTHTVIAALLALVSAACEGAEEGARAVPAPAGMVVDTVHPPEEALQRFRDATPARATALEGGETSVEALVARWVRAVESHDTAAIRRLVIDRAEYAWLYYPETAFSARPLYQPPELFWFRMQAGSEKGIVRVLRRLGGRGLGYTGVRCPSPPRIEGANRIHEYCEVRYRSEGGDQSAILFGGILERDGRFKFIGYGNQF